MIEPDTNTTGPYAVRSVRPAVCRGGEVIHFFPGFLPTVVKAVRFQEKGSVAAGRPKGEEVRPPPNTSFALPFDRSVVSVVKGQSRESSGNRRDEMTMNERQQAHVAHYLERLAYWQAHKPTQSTPRMLAARDADEAHPLRTEEEATEVIEHLRQLERREAG